jgi:pimeloyl-ACP methyl ester carboxylesterase
MIHTHRTAPTQFVEANGIRFAYRRFGKAGGVPLVFNMHYLGTMDYWDPTVTDGLARDREVILFDNAGVSSSSGEVPTTFEQMGANAVAFSRALGLNKADMLGFSIGGMVAQEITLQAPDLVRKLILDDRFHESCHKRGFIWIFGLLYRSRVPKMSGVEVSWQRGGGRLNCRLEMRIRRS